MGTVYVVHCVDTEGPLYEGNGIIFEQISKIFGIEIENTERNFELLQKGLIDLGDKKEGIQNLLKNHRVVTKGSWDEIDIMLKRVTSEEFRHKLSDTEGGGWIFNWFCMDHVGFSGINPRRREAGHHKIFDYYDELVRKQNVGDLVQFHHHPVSFSGNYHESGTAYWGRSTLNEILTRKIIDRKWFPCAYRPGFHTERPDSHWFLEQWIPFDYGNQAIEWEENDQSDLSDGRFGNWKDAPREWIPYHPSHDDYQVKGDCRRWITRCLNMQARIRELRQENVEDAFRSASEGKDVILAFTDHDYKDMEGEIERVRNMILIASNKYASVRFLFSDAIKAMREVLYLQPEKIDLKMKIELNQLPPRLTVTARHCIFGPQPFLAIKTKKGDYFWDNFDFNKKNQWSYTFDNNTFQMEDILCIGVAANNSYGMTECLLYDCKEQKYYKRILNV